MEIYEHSFYKEDLKYVAGLDLSWNKLKDRIILISGATGLIGSFFVDVIMYQNEKMGLNCKIIALGRNAEYAKGRFKRYWGMNNFCFVVCDVNLPIEFECPEQIDFVLHFASNTHPVAYATEPIDTIMTNIIGTKNMLEFASRHKASRCVFASSNEVYGENRGDVEKFDELYCGYIDCNTLRAGYPESKRCGEALCQAYIKQRRLDIVIARLTRSYGPTLLKSDTKALSQFLYKGIRGEDIVLKSSGTQFYSYTYVSDAVSGIFWVLFQGKCGEAYNIADEASDIMLKDLAAIIAEFTRRSVIFELPSEVEKLGFSKATKARMDSSKLKKIGWQARYDIRSGIKRTIDIIKESDSV